MSLLSDVEPVSAVLAKPHSLLEGPRIAGEGALVYSDVIAGGLFSCAADGTISELLKGRRGIGGVVPHSDGGWVISGRTVLHLRPDGSQRELLADDDARGYNDLGVAPGGGLLAGVLRYRPMAGEEPLEGRLVLLDGEGRQRVLSEQVQWPNGIGVSPDGQTVLISDYARALVLAVAIDGSGTDEFARMPLGSADGLALDQAGGVWVALGEGGGVARFHPDGSLDSVVELPATFISSISFGGADMMDVLISTADNLKQPDLGGTLLRARSAIAGMPVGVLSV
jgi:sugar lactone lactonase YvrE